MAKLLAILYLLLVINLRKGRCFVFTSKDNFMKYIPSIKHDKWEVKDNKVFLLFYHDKSVEKVLRSIFKKPRVTDIELDELGSDVWLSIDGKNTVYDISKKLINKHGEKCQPVNERLSMYLKYLGRRGWVKFSKEN